MDILVDGNNILITKGTITTDPETGYFYVQEENCNYLDNLLLIEDIEIPEGVTPQKYCYTAKDGFYLNPDYVEPEVIAS